MPAKEKKTENGGLNSLSILTIEMSRQSDGYRKRWDGDCGDADTELADEVWPGDRRAGSDKDGLKTGLISARLPNMQLCNMSP
jgi:hypothetical protein